LNPAFRRFALDIATHEINVYIFHFSSLKEY